MTKSQNTCTHTCITIACTTKHGFKFKAILPPQIESMILIIDIDNDCYCIQDPELCYGNILRHIPCIMNDRSVYYVVIFVYVNVWWSNITNIDFKPPLF